jgi:predicted transcriptional regulator
MLVEVPDPNVILLIITAFLVGMIGLYIFYKIRPYVNIKPTNSNLSYLDRLDYYERQLIDMKIRLDALNLEEPQQETKVSDVRTITHHRQRDETPTTDYGKESSERRLPNMDYENATEIVLKLITEKPMTSRDIQIALGRSREHTARLMKKLFQDGFVARNNNSKPYTYSLTGKGQERLKLIKSTHSIA